ncbi:potassium-transporting ATPase subunit KdpA [Alicyclobacillus mengziensis]|uniref:Potassium-transporting ATPase potassium-binding subunit n=1 Tax=Alicyclobacillus mengziensis TaxID=2931921 RepID=A0A9X7VXL4_9BACL|nr:potassium-transporting ATPase subunit KdpA [Alicyclobacillus mengziensis]QSO46903.1 potassium-transporting ATPase subunit KdpA [Alicyclobacillus mengziensis]
MTLLGSVQIVSVVLIIFAIGIPLGGYMYRVYTGQRSWLERVFAPIEGLLYKVVGVNPSVEMDWKEYLKPLMIVSFAVMLFAYIMWRLMGHLFLNPDGNPSMPPFLAFNTAASFITNTNWQNYSGETAMTYLGQLVVTILQFVAPALGMVSAVAVLRAVVNHRSSNVGNFWVDITRTFTRILLPISFVSAVILIGLGVPETLLGAQTVHTLQGATQTISRGPVASLLAIKQLGNNGGGYFNANSAQPLEDPSALTTVIEIILMSILSTAFMVTFGRFLRSRKWTAILYVFIGGMILAGAFVVYASESAGNPILHHLLGISGPNMEGKEVRFGLPLSSLFVSVTAGTETGAVNTMHDSLTPLGGLVPMVFMMFNMVLGGVGAGLLNIIMFLIITVFLAGLMVGRTPEIFGKKIEAREIKLAVIAMLTHPLIILIPTAIAVMTKTGVSSMGNPGLHGLSEVLYAFTSSAANNGSAFAGLDGNTPFYNLMGGVVMLLGRYVSDIAMFAIAGSLAMKPVIPESPGTLKANTFSFGWVFIAVVVIVGALTFFPALSIGPIGEQIQMWAGHLA